VEINPAVVEGQIRGGVAQGIGGALLETFPYAEDGQPLTVTFAEYLLPGTLQAALADDHGLQCGFCTPGFLMVATELLAEGRELDEHEVRERLSGNMCRCTGYQGIVEAVLAVASRQDS
jgi:hypothetical protein